MLSPYYVGTVNELRLEEKVFNKIYLYSGKSKIGY